MRTQAKNNSYETEPSSSSSSGNSLCGFNNIDYLETTEVNHIKLPFLLEPQNYVCENKVLVNADLEEERNDKSFKNISITSSEESPFAGFRETPLKELQEKRFIYEDTNESQLTKQTLDDDVVYVQTFPMLSTVVTEDSCNAVDMPLHQVPDSDAQASDLSFNGKIKALDLSCDRNKSDATQSNATFCHEKTSDLTTSSFNRYSMSPDLFADEDEDDETHVEENRLPRKLEPKSETAIESIKMDERIKLEQQVDISATNCATEYSFAGDSTLDKVTQNENNAKLEQQMDTSANRSLQCLTESSFADDVTMDNTTRNENNARKLLRENCKRERELLRRIRKCLSGVPPPPSLTIPQLDLIERVLDRKADILNFFKDLSSGTNGDNRKQTPCLFKPTHSLHDTKNMPWRDILGVRQHGLSFNLTTASEHCEYLSLSVVERFVGAETTSSYRRSPSSAKKRNLRVKLLPQSPGNRLSHLAKRRAIFSSANLATTSQRSATAFGPQIIIDKKKSRSRRKATPKRKTPGSKKKTRKTPSSSARKAQYRLDFTKPAPTRETSKRALFQSPMEIHQQQHQVRLTKPQIKPEIATKVEKSKRALFSPDMKTITNPTTVSHHEQLQFEKPATSSATLRLLDSMLLKRKRNEMLDDDDDVEGLGMPSKKLLRCDLKSLTPRALKIKSQSFCIGAGSSDAMLASKSTSLATLKSAKRNLLGIDGGSNNSFQSLSSTGSTGSLQGGGIGDGLSASFLSIDKKLQRAQSDMAASSASLSENQKKKLLWAVSQALQEKKITTKHENFKQHATVLGRVVRRIFQEFYQRISTSNSETLLRLSKKYVFYVISGRSCDDIYRQVRAEETSKRLSTSRLTGYIGAEEYQQRKQQRLSQTSMLSSFSLSQYGSMQNLLSIDDTNSQPATLASNNASYSKQRPSEDSSNLQNSSSKCNLSSLPLRENSAQKNFTGKDQRNVSPYAKGNSSLKLTANDSSLHASASAKAKRQILFDS